MRPQFKFFDDTGKDDDGLRNLPDGMRNRPAMISPAEEDALVARVRELPFKQFEFHGFKGKRRVLSFGWQYEFSGRGILRKADDIPEFLRPLRAVAASFGRVEPEALQQVAVIEYGPGAGIGWHRNKPVFGEVIVVSLLAPCVLPFRRKVATRSVGDPVDGRRRFDEIKTGSVGDRVRNPKKAAWQRMNVLAEPRSVYHLNGPARSEWEHSILRVDSLRYSITFRTMREE